MDEKILYGVIGTLCTVIGYLYRTLQKKNDQIIDLMKGVNNGSLEKLLTVITTVSNFLEGKEKTKERTTETGK